MQKNNMVLKRKVEIDDEELDGLVFCSALKSEKGLVEVPSFNQKTDITDDVKKLDPVDLNYSVTRDSDNHLFLYDFYDKAEVKDFVITSTDGTGQVVAKWLLPDCECSKYEEPESDFANIGNYQINITIVCTGKPRRLRA
jgi:hypothetical protein